MSSWYFPPPGLWSCLPKQRQDTPSPAPPPTRREQEAFKDGGEEEQETALSSLRDPYT